MSLFDHDPKTEKCSVPHPFAGGLANGWEAVRSSGLFIRNTQ
jgi:hypothetical protein